MLLVRIANISPNQNAATFFITENGFPRKTLPKIPHIIIPVTNVRFLFVANQEWKTFPLFEILVHAMKNIVEEK